MLPLISADDLASLFQTVSLSDELCFSRLPSSDETIAADEMTCSDSSLLVDSGNLVIKALNLMRVKTNIQTRLLTITTETREHKTSNKYSALHTDELQNYSTKK
jgi:4-diphosphocytidyl-2C-methyl-D-erythritol kinase